MPNEDNNIEEPMVIPEPNTESGIIQPHQHYHSDLIDKFVTDRYVSDPPGTDGMLIFNTTDSDFKGYNGTAWKTIAWDADIPDVTPFIRFGGDGSGGAYSISGEDTIDLGGVAVYVKNYSSINITATGDMNFSNPHANGTIVIIKCSGNATIAGDISMGDVTSLYVGATGGAGGAHSDNSGVAGSTGTSGSNQTGRWDSENNHFGAGGTGYAAESGAGGGGGGQSVAGSNGTTPANATIGSGGAKQSNFTGLFNLNNSRKTYFVACGAGGGGGGGGSTGGGGGYPGDGGDGGQGGGALILEVAGNLNITGGAIYAEGKIGEDGDTAGNYGDPNYPKNGGGGGGGAGGTVVVLYKGTLTGSATPSVVGGAGGNGGEAGPTGDYGGDGGAGAAGSYIFEKFIW